MALKIHTFENFWILYLICPRLLHFSLLTIAKQIETKLITPILYFSNYLSEPVEENLTCKATNKLEVRSIINSLNVWKAFDLSSI